MSSSNQKVTARNALFHSSKPSKSIKSHGAISEKNKKQINRNMIGVSEGSMGSLDVIFAKELIPVPQAFTDKFPDLSEIKQRKFFEQYLSVIRRYLVKIIPHTQDGTAFIPLKKLIDECGEFRYKTTRHYIWNEFKSICPFFYVMNVGNNLNQTKNYYERNSKVKIMNHKYIDLLIETSDTNELVSHFYGNIEDPDQLLFVDVDMRSLDNFIAHCDKGLSNTSNNEKLIEQIRKNRYEAKFVKIISQFFEPVYDKYCFPMMPTKSEYGRTYYTGINLMSMKEEVRRAVLGDYYQYDLNAAVYAVKLILAKSVLAENNESSFGKFLFTKEYLDRKTKLREELAKTCLTEMNLSFTSKVKVIKQALTAIGFGAKIDKGSWLVNGYHQYPSINEIIKVKADRERFINHPFIKGFVKEQQDMTTMIVKHHVKDQAFVDKIKSVKNMLTPTGNISKIQVMAYLYQHTEAWIMEQIEELSGNHVIRIHDALITKKAIKQQNLLDIKKFLNDLDSDLTLDCEHKTNWNNPNPDEIEDDDDRDVYVRNLIKSNTKQRRMPDIVGNQLAYGSTTQYEQIEEY